MPETLPAVFNRVSPDALSAALQYFRRIDVPFGTALMEEGDEDPTLICLLDGEVEIKTGGVDLGRAGPGDLLGEMALFGGGLRTATVKTSADTTFLMLDRPSYESLRDAANPVAQAIEEAALATLSSRLRDMNKRIGRLAEGTAAERVTPHPGLFERVSRLFGGIGGRSTARGVDKQAILRSSPVFSRTPEPALVELADKMTALSFSSGHFICTQGEFGKEMFVLGQGLVEIIVGLDNDKVEPLAQLDPGDVFGMASLIEDNPRMASCVARGSVIALSLDRDTYVKWTAGPEAVGSALRTAVIRSLVDQLAFANGQLAMLDLETKRKTGTFMKPLLKARGAAEAHSAKLRE